MYKILLACGAGASSGFIAQSMRKAAKQRGIEYQIRAVSDMEINNYINEYDILLIGPHIEYRLSEIKSALSKSGNQTPITVIDKKKYAVMDGEGILNDAIQFMGKIE